MQKILQRTGHTFLWHALHTAVAFLSVCQGHTWQRPRFFGGPSVSSNSRAVTRLGRVASDRRCSCSS